MKKVVFLFLGLVAIILVFFIAVGIVLFMHIPRPITIEEIGSLGDAFGGFLNPIFAFVNICLFIYLTFKVSEIGNKTSERLANQAKKFNSLKHLKSDFEKAVKVWRKDPDKGELPLHLYIMLEELFPEEMKTSNSYLTKRLKEVYNYFQDYSHDEDGEHYINMMDEFHIHFNYMLIDIESRMK